MNMQALQIRGLIGNERLLKALCFCMKQVLGANRPFVCIVIEQDGNASVHSNMDYAQERIALLEQTTASLKNPNSANIVQRGN